MQLLPHPSTTLGVPEKFIGDVWIDVLDRGEGPWPLRMSLVRFPPGARNAWHSHARGQTLYITEGVGLVQVRGEPAVLVRAGDVIYTPPGEWHWHGASRDHAMTHLAVFVGAGDGEPDAEWGEHVTVEEYDVCCNSTFLGGERA